MSDLSLKDYLYVECYGKQKLDFLRKIKIRRVPQNEAVYLLRKMQFAKSTKQKRKYQTRLIKKYGIFCGLNSRIGLGIRFPHPNGIIIGEAVEIGENTTIYQQVTIGSARLGEWKEGKQPVIGNNAMLFAGAKILGTITLGNNTTVGANAVLTKSTEADSTYAGVPAKRIK